MLDLLLQAVSSSRLFNGISTLAMQIGSRYMMAEIPSNVERAFNRPFFRRLFIFFVAYLAFRDIKWAILTTLIFIIVFNYVLDKNSKVYIGKFFGFGEDEKKEEKRGISLEELEKAKEIIKSYNQSLENQKIKVEMLK